MKNHRNKKWLEAPVSADFGMMSLTKKLTEVTERLGIKPSHSFQIGDEVLTQTGTHVRGRSVWQLRTEENINSSDLVDHLHWLLHEIEPHSAAIRQYLDDPEVEVVIRIDCHCHDSIGGLSIPGPLMKRIAVLANRFDFGFIGAEPESEEPDAADQEPCHTTSNPS